jgi:hypothetical protein
LHLGYHAAILNFFNPSKAATHYGGYFYKISWSLMKGIFFFLKSTLFCFHGNCDKVCPTDSDIFGLSRSTRCGCGSYQVSSISVWRVTCYDHFCVFHFFSILKNQPLKAQLHMAYDIPTRFHKVWSRHLREMCRTNFWRKKERKKKKKNNKKRSKHNMSPKLRLGDIIWSHFVL